MNQKLKLWPNSKTQILTKLKKLKFGGKNQNLNCEKTKILTKLEKLNLWQNQILRKQKNQILTKLKKSNCDESFKKILFWQNSKTQNMTQLKLWQNSKTNLVKKKNPIVRKKIVTKLKNSNGDESHKKTSILTKLKNSNYKKITNSKNDKPQKMK